MKRLQEIKYTQAECKEIKELNYLKLYKTLTYL